MFSINENNIEDNKSDLENIEKTYIKNKIFKKEKRSFSKEITFNKDYKDYKDNLIGKSSNNPPNKTKTQ